MQKLYKQNKLDEMIYFAEIGKMSAGLFHDVLNPINSLILYLDLLRIQQMNFSSLPRETKRINLQKEITQIIESSKNISDFIRSINQFDQTNLKENIDLCKTTEEVLRMLKFRLLNKNISLYFIRHRKIEVFVNKTKLFQVLMNLIANAIDSFESISDNRKKKIQIKIFVDPNNAEKICIKIIDNGCGMSQDTINKIFDKYFTTKKNGFGIGLSHTKKIIEKDFDGEISYESSLKKGTCCTVKINK